MTIGCSVLRTIYRIPSERKYYVLKSYFRSNHIFDRCAHNFVVGAGPHPDSFKSVFTQ